MHENILPSVLGDEPEAPLIIKPFNFSARHTYSFMFFLPWQVGEPTAEQSSKSPTQAAYPRKRFTINDPRQFANNVKSRFVTKTAKYVKDADAARWRRVAGEN